MMLSHLAKAKRSKQKVPKQFGCLRMLVDGMDTSEVAASTSFDALGDEEDDDDGAGSFQALGDVGSSDVEILEPAPPAADGGVVDSSDEERRVN